MARATKSGRIQLFKGMAKFLWEEVKTMNISKIRSLYQMTIGYMRMKFQHRKIERTSRVTYEAL